MFYLVWNFSILSCDLEIAFALRPHAFKARNQAPAVRVTVTWAQFSDDPHTASISQVHEAMLSVIVDKIK